MGCRTSGRRRHANTARCAKKGRAMSRSTVHATLTGLDIRAIVFFETDSEVLAKPPLLCRRKDRRIVGSLSLSLRTKKDTFYHGVEGKMHPPPVPSGCTRHSDVDGVDRAPGLHESSHSHDNEGVRISTFRRSQESLAFLRGRRETGLTVPSHFFLCVRGGHRRVGDDLQDKDERQGKTLFRTTRGCYQYDVTTYQKYFVTLIWPRATDARNSNHNINESFWNTGKRGVADLTT
jgi:hypothetical protein